MCLWMSLGKAGSEKFAPARSTISAVHNQLSNGFLPAVKHVAASSSELLKAHQQLQKAAEMHAIALKGLADSAKGGQPACQRHAKALQALVADYEHFMEFHKKTMTRLAFIAQKTTLYSNGEKDKLKEMKDNHHKKEKDILKEEKKGSKSESDLGAFYAAEAKSFATQQEMRYKFFVDKHVEWFDSFSPMLKIGNERLGVGSEEKKEEKKEEVHHPKEEKVNGTAEKIEVGVAILPPVHEKKEETRIMDHTPIDDVLALEEFDDATVETPEELHEPTRQQRRGDYIEQAQKRGVAVAVLPIGAPVNNLKHVEKETPRPPERVDSGVQAELTPSFVVERPTQTNPDFVPTSTVIHHTEFQPVHITSPVVSPSPPPKPQVVVPSQFGAGDYGKTLTVTQDYPATSGEQLTVGTGDKVVLIKSGNRGWIFIRDCVSQRTGWIPAPYVSF